MVPAKSGTCDERLEEGAGLADRREHSGTRNVWCCANLWTQKCLKMYGMRQKSDFFSDIY